MGYGRAMTPDYRPNLVRSFERHLRAENRSEHTIASYLKASAGPRPSSPAAAAA
jgi:hypothetical protein